jgi:selenocysteine-specific elongation factor
MSCIGTAGHVDHGKSTLVKALTGIDPDRLAEEKERGMTIDLGFAWLKLPGGREVSIVDVPGHESFIKNMLAGVGGIDAALLVVAADEGVMPQTREHLAILDLLHVQRGIVALTKTDLVDDEWLELVREEVTELLKPTTLAGAELLPVSAQTGQGLPELLQALERLLNEADERQNIGRPRLPVDRVFTLTGFGTVVTGTLLDGNFKSGQEVELLPRAIKTRIRSLQTHKQQVEVVRPGNRVAMNLPNVQRTELARGDVVVLPGQMHTTALFDARIQLLAAAPRALAHNTLVDFYSGSQEIPARVRLLDCEELQPGKSAWVQLRLQRPAVVAHRDRFILRIPSPSMTIGGGEILDVQPRYHRRFQAQVSAALEQIAQGSPAELVLAVLEKRRSTRSGSGSGQGFVGYKLSEIVQLCNLSEDVTRQILDASLSAGRVRKVGELWFALFIWEALAEEAVRLVYEQHQRYPLRSGLSKEEWRARLGLSAKIATEVFTILQAEGRLEVVGDTENGDTENGYTQEALQRGGLIRRSGFVPSFTIAQQRQVEQLLQHFYAHPYTPPDRSEVEALAGAEIVGALIEQGRLVKIGNGIVFLRETYAEALVKLVEYLRKHDRLTASEARDILGTTRKYVVPLLEHLDALHITRRIGDERVLGNTPPPSINIA